MLVLISVPIIASVTVRERYRNITIQNLSHKCTAKTVKVPRELSILTGCENVAIRYKISDAKLHKQAANVQFENTLRSCILHKQNPLSPLVLCLQCPAVRNITHTRDRICIHFINGATVTRINQLANGFGNTMHA